MDVGSSKTQSHIGRIPRSASKVRDATRLTATVLLTAIAGNGHLSLCARSDRSWSTNRDPAAFSKASVAGRWLHISGHTFHDDLLWHLPWLLQ